MTNSPMRVHLVHAHPETDSFVAAMRDTIIAALRHAGHHVTVSDLYAMEFNPVLSAADFGDRAEAEHLTYALEQRHNWKTGTLASDIMAEIEQVLASDILGFTFPVHWFGPPAILKGWIERVFISGPFYGGRRIYSEGGLTGKRAFAALSLGGRSHMFGPRALHGPLIDGMLKHFFQGTLGYVGLAVHEPFVAWHVPYVDGAARRQMLEDLETYMNTLDTQPLIDMPDLSAFDETFLPKG